jgi:hypothetical protein
MASVAFRLFLLKIALIAVGIAYVRISGVGIPPYHAVPEPFELERVHRLVGLALFAVAALSADFSPRLSSSSSWVGSAVGPTNHNGLQFAQPNLQSVFKKPGYNVSRPWRSPPGAAASAE